MARTFLQAEWRKLAMANYAVDPKMLAPYLPHKTELDLWDGVCYVSLVGFLFRETKLRGIKIPFHTRFEEVNLRFYVRYKENDSWKRGVVFIREIVPKPALTFVANTVYGEKYVTMPMKHSWTDTDEHLAVEYKWKRGQWNSFRVIAEKSPVPIADGSKEEFITEHYWGYTKTGADKTSEYGVEHPKWEVYPTKDYSIEVDFGSLYGNDFHILSSQKPASVFLAEGSEIKVKSKRRI